MRVLFDTHALAWWLLDDIRLSVKVRTLIIDPDCEVWVSAVSAFEIATKYRIGKWPEAGAIANNFEAAVTTENFRVLDLTAAHAKMAGLMAGEHRDPFDRLIAAQAMVEKLPVATGDPAFKAFGRGNHVVEFD